MPNLGDAHSMLIEGLPGSEAAVLSVATVLLRERKISEGKDFIDRAVSKFSSTAMVVLQAKFWKESGRANEAVTTLVSLLREHGSNVDVLTGLVECLIECEEFERARDMLIRALHLDPTSEDLNDLNTKLTRLEALDVKKHGTMAGTPNALAANPVTDATAIVTLAERNDKTIESGTFADLAAYAAESEREDTLNVPIKISELGDQNFDSVLDSMGVSIPSQTSPASSNNDDGSTTDQTSALRVDAQGNPYSPSAPSMPKDLFTSAPTYGETPQSASPEEKTEFIFMGDRPPDPIEDRTNSLVVRNHPTVDLDATAHLIVEDKDLTEEETQNRIVKSSPQISRRDHMQNVIDELDNEATQHIVLEDEFPESDDEATQHVIVEEGILAAARPPTPAFSATPTAPAPAPSFSAVPSDPAPSFTEMRATKLNSTPGLPPNPHEEHRSPAPFQAMPMRTPQAVESTQSDMIPFAASGEFAAAGKMPKFNGPSDKSAPVPTAVGRAPRKKKSKKWPLIIGVMCFVLLLSAIGVVVFGSTSRTKTLNQNLLAVQKATDLDDYHSYLNAKKKISTGLSERGFIAGMGDKITQTFSPQSSNPEIEHLALLAFIDALLEARFESSGSQNAAISLENVKNRAPEHPNVWLAETLNTYTAGRPYDAIIMVEKAKEKFPKSTLVDEVSVLLFSSLNEDKKAYKSGASLRKKESPSIRERYYAALSLEPNDRDALPIFSEVLAKNPNHLDAIIDRSYLLRDGASELKKAENELTQLPREASQYQAARASIALGYLLLAKNDKAAAEENFGTAIRKMPERSELYQPLLDFYFQQGRYSDATKTIDQVEGEISTQLSLTKAELLILESKYQDALLELNRTTFVSPEKDWLRGLAYFHQQQYEKALAEFNKTIEGSREHPKMAAFRELSRVSTKENSGEDVLQPLNQLKTEFPTDAYVKFALAKIRIKDGVRTKSLAKREDQFKAARKELIKAVKLKTHPMFFFELCDLYRLELDFEKAKSNCAKGRKFAENYLPGQLTLAKLKIDEGAFEDANDILKVLRKSYPDNVDVGLLSVRVNLGRRHLKSARTELNKWLARPNANPFELNVLDGKIRFLNKSYGQAVGFFENAYKLNKSDPEATIFFAHTLTRLGRIDEALPLLRDAKRHPVWQGLALIVEGETYRKKGKFDLAIASLDKARKFFKKRRPKGETYSILFTERALSKKEKFGWTDPSVAAEFDQARRNGDLDEPYFNLKYGQFFMNQDQPNIKKASKAFARVLKTEPGNCTAIHTLVDIYKKSRSKKTLKRYTRAQKKHCKK